MPHSLFLIQAQGERWPLRRPVPPGLPPRAFGFHSHHWGSECLSGRTLHASGDVWTAYQHTQIAAASLSALQCHAADVRSLQQRASHSFPVPPRRLTSPCGGPVRGLRRVPRRNKKPKQGRERGLLPSLSLLHRYGSALDSCDSALIVNKSEEKTNTKRSVTSRSFCLVMGVVRTREGVRLTQGMRL